MSNIWGKVLGGAVGFVMGGPVGAFVGAAVGHAVDINAPSFQLFDASAAQRAFFEALFLVMGHVAKADGRVSEREIRVAEEVMHRMQLTEVQRQQAIKLFNRGKRSEFNLATTLQELGTQCGTQPQLFRLFIEVLLDAGHADGALSRPGRQVLEQCCAALGVERWELERMINLRRGGYRAGASGAKAQISDPYEVLGLASDADDRAVKQAYRRLINQNHPDKLVSKGLPAEMLDLAKDRTAQIRAAYEQIRANRGFR